MTETEKNFFVAIKNSVGTNYTVHPQINLATVIEYQNELYRNVDFGVFDNY